MVALEGGDDFLVVLNVVEGEGAAAAVFEPLVADLVAADVKLPHLGGYAVEILRLLAAARGWAADVDAPGREWLVCALRVRVAGGEVAGVAALDYVLTGDRDIARCCRRGTVLRAE